METNSNNNTATFIHLSSLSQYFIPFGNFIFPILIWSSKKNESEFIDYNGKQVINFQLSLFLYTLLLGMIAIPIIFITVFQNIPFDAVLNDDNFVVNHMNLQHMTGTIIVALTAIFIFIGLKVAEFFLIIYASLKTSNGEKYNYPLTIPFMK